MADFWTSNYWNDVPHYNYQNNSHDLPSWDKDAFWVYAGNHNNGYQRWDETYVWIPNIIRETPIATLFCEGPGGNVKYTLVQRTTVVEGTATNKTYQNQIHNEVGVSVEAGFNGIFASGSVKSELRHGVTEMSSNAIEKSWSNSYENEERFEVSTKCSGWETVQISTLQMKLCAYRKKQGYELKSSGPSSWQEPFLHYDFLASRWSEGKLFKVSHLQRSIERTELTRKDEYITISDIINNPQKYNINDVKKISSIYNESSQNTNLQNKFTKSDSLNLAERVEKVEKFLSIK